MGVLKLNNMEFFAYHGHFEEETKVGNFFRVNLALNTDTDKAAESDDLNDALNYVEVYHLIKNEMDKPSKLLENVAQRIMDNLFLQFSNIITAARLEIEKMNPPIGGKMESVSVVLER